MKNPTSPSWRPLLRGSASEQFVLLALSGLGTGLSPLAPGTVGTLAAWGAVLALPAGALVWAMAGLGVLVVGTVLVDRVQRRYGIEDPAWVVVDEIAAFWLLLAATGPPEFEAQLALFLLFRAFDAVKPWPVSWVERRWSGGWGVMADDLVAAAMAGLVFLGWQAAAGGL